MDPRSPIRGVKPPTKTVNKRKIFVLIAIAIVILVIVWMKFFSDDSGGGILGSLMGGSSGPLFIFDSKWYLSKYPDIAQSSTFRNNPFSHWVQHGIAEGRLPSNTYDKSRFDASFYLSKYPDIAKDPIFGKNPFRHYAQYGILEGRATNASEPPKAWAETDFRR
jgi:hypothetical protein